MAGFKASEAISTLNYDFTGFTVADERDAELLAKAKGTTPEPSGRQIRHFYAQQQKLFGLEPGATPQEIQDVVSKMTEDELHEMDEEIMDLMSAVTSGSPSREVLEALPFRIREMYYGWLLGELANPTIGTNGTSRRSLVPINTNRSTS